jgi:hypothetical protein
LALLTFEVSVEDPSVDFGTRPLEAAEDVKDGDAVIGHHFRQPRVPVDQIRLDDRARDLAFDTCDGMLQVCVVFNDVRTLVCPEVWGPRRTRDLG